MVINYWWLFDFISNGIYRWSIQNIANLLLERKDFSFKYHDEIITVFKIQNVFFPKDVENEMTSLELLGAVQLA